MDEGDEVPNNGGRNEGDLEQAKAVCQADVNCKSVAVCNDNSFYLKSKIFSGTESWNPIRFDCETYYCESNRQFVYIYFFFFFLIM